MSARLVLRLTAPLCIAAWSLVACKGTDSPTPTPPNVTPAQLVITAGTGESAFVRSILPAGPAVVVRNSANAALAGVVVRFAVLSGGGVVSPDSAVTDAGGAASATWALGATAGLQQVQATVQRTGASPLQATFSATAKAAGHPVGYTVTTRTVTQGPFGVAVSGSGLVYVTQVYGSTLMSADIGSLALTDSIVVGHAPAAVAFSPLGDFAFVANENDDDLGIVRVSTAHQIRAAVLHHSPFNVAMGPGGTRVYVSTNAGWVFIVDAAAGVVLDSIATTTSATSSMVFNSTGTLLYVAGPTNSQVFEVNVATRQVQRTINVPGIPQGIALSPNDSLLYVANEGSNAVEVWRLATAHKDTSITITSPFDLALTPDATQMWVGSPLGKVVVYDRATLAVDTTITVGGTPRRIRFSPDGRTAVVANESGYINFIR